MMKSKKGQITVFVIVALVLVAGIAGYFLLKDKIFTAQIPTEFVPIYDYYLSCIESNAVDGTKLLGTQAGYIELPAFEPGSQYAPFSSQLDFLGFGIPYWYYVSGNGVVKEQIPTKRQMQTQLGDYISSKLEDCDFTEFRRQGFIINVGEASASTEITDDKISVRVSQSLTISKGEGEEQQKVVVNSHNAELNSKLGKYYNLAKSIYDYQKKNMFLENYAVDVLNLYAPVTGTESSCSPLVWNPYDVVTKLQNALEANVQAIKISKEPNDYFAVDTGVELNGGEQIDFLYSPSWANRFEVWPTKNGIMMANVVGPQQGLGALGFCYVSYKFVYDMYFPVLVQIYSGNDAEDIFQFPVSVVVSKNQPREAMAVESLVGETKESVCDKSISDISVYTYDTTLAPVEANIQFKCFTDVCSLGKTNITGADAILNTKIPQCVNGLLIATADGYADKKYYISTNEESIADIVLNKKYNLAVEIYIDGKKTDNMAVLSISKKLEDGTSEMTDSIAYPFNSKIDLAEGDYEFDLQVYSEKQITLPETKQQTCTDVPKGGVLGVLGMTEEQCFDYVIPSQTLSKVLYAGGSQTQYITPTELEGASKIRIYAESVALPSSVDKLQEAYNLVEIKKIRIEII